MIEVKNIVKIFNKGKSNEFEALRGVSMKIEDGEMVAIIGASGAGKSTILHILGCLDDFDQGEYEIDGTEIKNMSPKALAAIRNEKIGMVMQDFALVEGFTALENVMIPLDFARKKKQKKDRRKIAMEMLEKVHIGELADKPVENLSGGQKQRVAIARAIANDPAILLADEPTGSLDTESTEKIVELFQELNRQGITIVLVTHDENVANQCGRRIKIQDGKNIQ